MLHNVPLNEQQYKLALIDRRVRRILHLKKLQFSIAERRSYVSQFIERDYELGLVNLSKAIARNEMAILLLDLSLELNLYYPHKQ